MKSAQSVEITPETNYADIIVPTAGTVRMSFLIDMLLTNKKPVSTLIVVELHISQTLLFKIDFKDSITMNCEHFSLKHLHHIHQCFTFKCYPPLDQIYNCLCACVPVYLYVCVIQVLCIGPTCTGKTLTLSDKLLNNMPAEYITHFLMFSARTSANQTQDYIDSKLDKRYALFIQLHIIYSITICVLQF